VASPDVERRTLDTVERYCASKKASMALFAKQGQPWFVLL
jgi:hypothetical protein